MGSSPSPSPSPSLTTIGPLLLRSIITSMYIFIDRYLLPLAAKFKLLHILRSFFLSSFLFFLRLLPSLFPCLNPSSPSQIHDYPPPPSFSSEALATGDLNSGITRALTQLLAIVSNLPVSSRKYEIVRSLTDRLLDENLQVGSEALRQVNCRVLSQAFTRTLRLLDEAVWNEVGDAGEDWGLNLSRVVKAVGQYGTKLMKEQPDESLISSAEKVAAELLWLAERMASCGCGQEAVTNWGSATRLARMALSVQPRLQGSLVRISAFLFKQAKSMGVDKDAGENAEDGGEKRGCNESKMKILMSWLPLLCRASNGVDAPILGVNERSEVEKALEETIEKLEGEGEREKVLSLWLHYFTHCPSTDWPNLYSCYIRWCHASRNSLLAAVTD